VCLCAQNVADKLPDKFAESQAMVDTFDNVQESLRSIHWPVYESGPYRAEVATKLCYNQCLVIGAICVFDLREPRRVVNRLNTEYPDHYV